MCVCVRACRERQRDRDRDREVERGREIARELSTETYHIRNKLIQENGDNNVEEHDIGKNKVADEKQG